MTAIILWVAGFALVWRARPQTEWSGENAALFCAGLIAICSGSWQLLTWLSPAMGSTETNFLFASISHYAALPLLFLVAAIQGLQRSGYIDAKLLH